MARQRVSLTAAQVVLLAADDLDQKGVVEFTEWDLTVSAWTRDHNRFGLRGYETEHPDHKRVMMEIMGKTKKDNPIRRGFMEKTRANHYHLTDLGRAEAKVLGSRADADHQSALSPQLIYNAVRKYTDSKSFQAFLADPNEPRSWLGAATFLGLSENTPNELNDRIRSVYHSVQQAENWCEENDRNGIRDGPTGGAKAIPLSKIRRLPEFLEVLEQRFERQMDAIREKGE